MSDFDPRVAELIVDPKHIEIVTYSGHRIELGVHHLHAFCQAMQRDGFSGMRANFRRFGGCTSCGDSKKAKRE